MVDIKSRPQKLNITPSSVPWFTDYLDSKFILWPIRSSYKRLLRGGGLHLPAHDQPSHTINKSNNYFYFSKALVLVSECLVRWTINVQLRIVNTV